MRKSTFLLALVITGAAIAPVAKADVSNELHERCIRATDYKGCVSTGVNGVGSSDSFNRLKSATQTLPSRLQSTNLRDFTANTQSFRDAVTSIEVSDGRDDYEKDFITNSKRLLRMVDVLQEAWSRRIHKWTTYVSGTAIYMCRGLQADNQLFNAVAGRNAVYLNTRQERFFFAKQTVCYPNETQMVRAISEDVRELMVDPEVKKARIAREEREQELARLEPWERHLEENPNLKIWAEANPKAAEQARERFLREKS